VGRTERFAVYVGVTAVLFAMLALSLGYELLYLPGDLQAAILMGFVMAWTLLHLGLKKFDKKPTSSGQVCQSRGHE
jgi:hypothetical protein